MPFCARICVTFAKPYAARGVQRILLAIAVLAVTAVYADAQTPNSARPENTTATQVQQLPLSGKGNNVVPPVIIQQRPSEGSSTTSVIVTDTTVAVQGPYAGSVRLGKAADGVLPLTLQQALAMGLKQNLGALTESATEQQARGLRLAAKSQLLPRIDVGVSENVEKENLRTLGVSLPTIPPTSVFNYYDARVRLNQTVLDFVKIRNLRGASENVKASIASVRNSRDLIVLAVGGSYLQLTASHARVEAAAAQVKTSQVIYQQAADRFNAGLANRVDVNRAEVELKTEQQRLRSLQADEETQKLKLARVIGLPLDQTYSAADVYPFDPALNFTPESAMQRAIAQRQDLVAGEAAVRAAQATLSAAHAERLPNVAIDGDFGAAGVTPTNHSTSVYTVSGVLTVPIYEGGRIRADAMQAEATLKQRKAEFEDTRGQVEQDIRQAFIDLRSSMDQVSVAQANVKLAHETLLQSQDRFLQGVADSVEVVQSEQAVVQADDDLITALFEHNLAKVSLARAMGDAQQTLPQLLSAK